MSSDLVQGFTAAQKYKKYPLKKPLPSILEDGDFLIINYLMS